MNKTVCIYPKDESTDFLSPLYDFLCEKGCEGWHKDTTENTDEAYALIKEADSIIFLGHGASDTLYGSPQDGEFTVLINETNIQELLYGKRCFILACNSYEFCENYNLTSFIGFGNMPTGIVDVKIAMEADTTFPSLEKEDIAGIAITELGSRMFTDAYERRVDPRGKVYYWMAGELINEPEDASTDIAAVRNNKISITPVTFEMTRVNIMQDLEATLCTEDICNWFA